MWEGSNYSKLLWKTTEEEQRQEATTNPKEMSMDAAVAAVLSKLDDIFTLKEELNSSTQGFCWTTLFPLYSRLALATGPFNTWMQLAMERWHVANDAHQLITSGPLEYDRQTNQPITLQVSPCLPCRPCRWLYLAIFHTCLHQEFGEVITVAAHVPFCGIFWWFCIVKLCCSTFCFHMRVTQRKGKTGEIQEL